MQGYKCQLLIMIQNLSQNFKVLITNNTYINIHVLPDVSRYALGLIKATVMVTANDSLYKVIHDCPALSPFNGILIIYLIPDTIKFNCIYGIYIPKKIALT